MEEYILEEKTAFDGRKVKVIGPTYEPGKPEGEGWGQWRTKLESREEILRYLENGLRYWYGKEWYGSERRKNPA